MKKSSMSKPAGDAAGRVEPGGAGGTAERSGTMAGISIEAYDHVSLPVAVGEGETPPGRSGSPRNSTAGSSDSGRSEGRRSSPRASRWVLGSRSGSGRVRST